MTTYMGFNIIIDDELMSKTIEDWSDVRSPSRAKRRMKRGFKQKVTFKRVPKEDIYKFGDKLLMHSDVKAKLLRKIDEQPESNYSSDTLRLPDWTESKSEKWQYGINPFRKDSFVFAHNPWLYN